MPEEELARAGLVAGKPEELDAEVSLRVWQKPRG
jgi:hypothetical protein